jgi:hypothetical protein
MPIAESESEMTDSEDGEPEDGTPREVPRLRIPSPGKRLVPSSDRKTPPLTGEQRLLLLDTWRRSGLPAGDFAALVGISKHTLYSWNRWATWTASPRHTQHGLALSRTVLHLLERSPLQDCHIAGLIYQLANMANMLSASRYPLSHIDVCRFSILAKLANVWPSWQTYWRGGGDLRSRGRRGQETRAERDLQPSAGA